MLLVANWPSRRVEHWNVLLKARAIENQSWVIGVNRVGQNGNNIQYPGRSVVHDPLGACAADLGEAESCRLVELDLSLVSRTRDQFPFLADADNFRIEDAE
jgi:predicted amidohydrolase